MNNDARVIGQVSSISLHNVNTQNIRKLGYQLTKRFLDVIIALFGLLFLIPVYICVKIAYVLTGDFTSVIYSQNRIGLNGKEFRFYKFRSMVPDADDILKLLLETNKAARVEYEENKKLKNDPRVTKIGKFLRKTSLDELPQLINILKGDMALIGNRPYLPREKQDMGLLYRQVVKTKPGLTGYWQTNGRSDVSFDRRLELESWYSNHYSFKLDVKIFKDTFKVVLGCKSAR